MTTENKLKIVELTFNIKQMCNKVENTILTGQGAYCFESGYFNELDTIFELAKKLNDLNV